MSLYETLNISNLMPEAVSGTRSSIHPMSTLVGLGSAHGVQCGQTWSRPSWKAMLVAGRDQTPMPLYLSGALTDPNWRYSCHFCFSNI